MSEGPYSCPVALRLQGKTRFVLWVEPAKGENYLLKRAGRIFVAKSESELRRSVRTLKPPAVMWKWKSRIDLDAFFRKVGQLKPGCSSKVPTCKVLLDGWNFLEDIARTVGAIMSQRIHSKKGPIWKMYDKLFWGCNVPSMTPPGEQYWPTWTESEIRSFKPALRELADTLRARAPELFS